MTEYDAAADWCAYHNLKGKEGDPLPMNLSLTCFEEINSDPEAFERRVRDCAYERAMNRRIS